MNTASVGLFGNTPLFEAVSDNDEGLVRLLLEHGGTASLGHFDDDLAWTPLHAAINNGSRDLVRLLLAAGADPDAHDERRIGDTPLFLAVGSDHPPDIIRDMVRTLRSHEADPRIACWMQLTPQHRAEERRDAAKGLAAQDARRLWDEIIRDLQGKPRIGSSNSRRR